MSESIPHFKTKLQRFVDEIVTDRKLHPICEICKHGKDQHAFDIYPISEKEPEPCWISCLECYNEQTERMKKEGKLKE